MKKVILAAVLFASMGTQLDASNINPRNFEKLAFSYKKLPQRDITAIHNMCVNVAIDTLESVDPNCQLSQSSSNEILQLSYATCVFAML